MVWLYGQTGADTSEWVDPGGFLATTDAEGMSADDLTAVASVLMDRNLVLYKSTASGQPYLMQIRAAGVTEVEAILDHPEVPTRICLRES
jgi:hypothetical protein